MHCTGVLCTVQAFAALYRGSMHCTGVCYTVQGFYALYRRSMHCTGVCCLVQALAALQRHGLYCISIGCMSSTAEAWDALYKHWLHCMSISGTASALAALPRRVFHVTKYIYAHYNHGVSTMQVCGVERGCHTSCRLSCKVYLQHVWPALQAACFSSLHHQYSMTMVDSASWE